MPSTRVAFDVVKKARQQCRLQSSLSQVRLFVQVTEVDLANGREKGYNLVKPVIHKFPIHSSLLGLMAKIALTR